ncbi:MAG: DUF4395 family protein [Patescibacteria group bacterium]|jgi:hypothetical protein
MKQCQIYDGSLKFSRATYGVLTLIAFFTRSEWLVLAVSLLIILGAFSLKLNIPYQFHTLVIKKMMKNQTAPVQKESGELNFVAAMTGALLLFGFLLLYFNVWVNFAWIFILLVALLIFLACFVGFCVATLMYVLMKKMFKRKSEDTANINQEKSQ